MRNYYIFTFIIIISLFTTSCSRYYYKPNAVNAPLFTKGGQAHVNIAGSFGSGDGTTGDDATSFLDIQAAVSPINHLGIIVNYSTYKYTTLYPDYNSGNVDAFASLAEIGVGGYMAVGERKAKLVMDFYGGYGRGNINSDVDMDVNRIFLQPGIGMHSPWVDVSFNPRFSYVSYTNFNDNGRSVQYLQNQGLIDYQGRRIDSRTYTFFEPTITVRTGYKFAKVQFQAAFANAVSPVPWNYNGARFTIGFYLSIEDIIEMAKK